MRRRARRRLDASAVAQQQRQALVRRQTGMRTARALRGDRNRPLPTGGDAGHTRPRLLGRAPHRRDPVASLNFHDQRQANFRQASGRGTVLAKVVQNQWRQGDTQRTARARSVHTGELGESHTVAHRPFDSVMAADVCGFERSQGAGICFARLSRNQAYGVAYEHCTNHEDAARLRRSSFRRHPQSGPLARIDRRHIERAQPPLDKEMVLNFAHEPRRWFRRHDTASAPT